MYLKIGRISCFFLIAIFTSALIGCGKHYRVEPIINTDKPYATVWKEKELLEEREYINPYTYNPAAATTSGKLGSTGDSLYAQASDFENSKKSRLARNKLQNAIISLSDKITAKHHSHVKATENNFNIFLGFAAMGLSGSASVLEGSLAQYFSAGATGAGGTRELLNTQVFRELLGESLIRAVQTDRKHFLETVITPRQKLDVLQYDVEAAIRDASYYHYRGSFYNGLSLLVKAAEKANEVREDEIKKSRSYEDPEDKEMRKELDEILKNYTLDTKNLDSEENPKTHKLWTIIEYADKLAREIDPKATLWGIRDRGGKDLYQLIIKLKEVSEPKKTVPPQHRKEAS